MKIRLYNDNGNALNNYMKWTLTNATDGGESVTFSLGGYRLGGLSDWLVMTGAHADFQTLNISTTNNISAKYFIGNGSQLTDLPTGDNSSWNESRANTIYVPYTGATANVSLGSMNLSTTGKLWVGTNTATLGQITA